MDIKDFIEKYPFLKQNLLSIALGLLGLIFLGYGLIGLIGSSGSSREIIFEPGSDSVLSSESNSEQDKIGEIVVDVSGAVLKPGVYILNPNSRVSNALIAAGGLSESADRDWVAKNINMALKLGDAAKIYIPRAGEEALGSITSTGSFGIGQININTASEEMLDSLPGIGPVTAQKIINARPYSSIEELLSKKVVGNKVFEQIKEKITAY